MICKEFKCIFVHVPKAAGMSVEHYFLNLLGMTWETRAPLLLRPNDDPSKGPARLAHLYAEEYVKFGYISQEQFNEYYKFSFVRNPWARIVSEYKFRHHNIRFTFSDFIKHHLPEPGMDDAYRHIVPQYNFTHSPDGQCLVDYIGKFESLQNDFDVVAKQLGFADSTLPHINDTKKNAQYGLNWKLRKWLMSFQQKEHKNYRDYYNDELKKIVSKLYEQDIDTYK
ncbi:MAG: sulfotransferase family 2 domain-containing protein, partial [Ketobacter sp.]